jgi:hypothetical protein
MTRMAASISGRGALGWCLTGFSLIGVVLPYAVMVTVYATVRDATNDRPFLDPFMISNALPFVAVTLLGLGQLSSGVGRWISSLVLILIGAASVAWYLQAVSWWPSLLQLLSVLAVALAAWYGDAAARRWGIVGSAVGVFALSVQFNWTLWRAVFLRLPGFSTWPVGFAFSIIDMLFLGVLVGYLCGVVAYGLVRIASRLRTDAPPHH